MSEDKNTILPVDLKKSIDAADNVLLLDVRSAEEYDFSKIEGSILIPLDELDGRIDEIVNFREKQIVTICHHGMRSLMAADQLATVGFNNVKSLTGGVDAWSIEIDSSMPRY